MAKKNGSGLPAELMEAFEADSGSGFEGVTTDDLQIPFIRLIQALSPQVDKNCPLPVTMSRMRIVTRIQVWSY